MDNLDTEGRSNENLNNDVNLELDSGEDNYTYTPHVSDELKPKKGQEFETINDVFTFYNAYAKAAGFSVRAWTSKREAGEIIRKEFVCFKQGKSSIVAEVGKKRRRGSIGEDCKAKIAVLRSSSNKYNVTIFNEGHSHSLSTPSKVHLLRSHRHVSAATKSLAKQMSEVNIPQHQQFSFLGVQCGGLENIGCTQRDLYNHERDMRADVEGHDGEMFYEYMKFEQTKNPSFTFKIEADEEQKITRCFWSDATSRRAYKFFGDVVIFDTTYNTNRYGLIFAPIMGVNNHGQTIIFGCGFLSHESIDDFKWLFAQFLESMPGDAPKMIITDQDPAMAMAFPIILPNTFHRYCIWHILTKFSERIDAAKYNMYRDEFSDCIWKSETPEEFELHWENLVNKSGLKENKWLEDKYKIRSRWVPAYVNNIFSAGMSSSQRAESGHAFFKKYVSKSNSLVDFMIQFGRGLLRQRHEELAADHKDGTEKPKIRIYQDWLVQMADIYTHNIYYKFENELCNSLNFKINLVKEADNHRVYQIHRKKIEGCKVRELIYDKDMDFVTCSCKKFESTGIPCRHIIAYLMKFDDVEFLPDKYILKRWTKSAKSVPLVDDKGVHIEDDKTYVFMRNQFIQSSLDLVDKALAHEETRKILTDGLRSIHEQIDNFLNNLIGMNPICSNPMKVDSSANVPCNIGKSYNDPDLVRAKGCGKRLKGGKEKALAKSKTIKSRRCHGCGKTGQSHDKRNCPERTDLLSTSNDENMEDGNGSSSTDDEDDIG